MTEKKKESGELSRRDFLKDAGLVVGGAAVGSVTLLAACTPSETTKTVETTKTIEATKTVTTTETVEVPMTFPASEGYIVVDSKKCSGCLTCMLACSVAHEGKENLSLSRIQILQTNFEPYGDIVQALCRQCVNPLCVQACPTGACHVDTANGNVRVIDESLCIGCKLCLEACPFIPHRTIWDAAKNKATKCDLCGNTPYWDGSGPACAEVCPNSAIKFTTDVPSQLEDEGYVVNLRQEDAWGALGWPID